MMIFTLLLGSEFFFCVILPYVGLCILCMMKKYSVFGNWCETLLFYAVNINGKLRQKKLFLGIKNIEEDVIFRSAVLMIFQFLAKTWNRAAISCLSPFGAFAENECFCICEFITFQCFFFFAHLCPFSQLEVVFSPEVCSHKSPSLSN